ncbi:MAG: ATP-binding cassette domain-containing protein, partial [Candidatus Moraniibacteriota bacterium]
MLTIKNLTVTPEEDKKKIILKNVSTVFAPNKTYCIMGPNGSGKSTLGETIMGSPRYAVSRGSKITFEKKGVTRKAPYERARMGIFLSFQNPLPLS